MIRWLYGEISTHDRERILKFLLCTFFGFLYAYLIRDPYSVTAAVTANLILFIDRGFRGSIQYGWKRLEIQIIQGGMTFAIIYIVKYWLQLPVHDTILVILVCSAAIVIALPWHYKHQIAPATTTLANATFIMACGILHNPVYFPLRLSHCLVGALIGLLINWVVMPQHDRFWESLDEIKCCADYLRAQIMSGIYPETSPSSVVSTKSYSENRALLATNMQHLPDDNGKIPFKTPVTADAMQSLMNLGASIKDLEQILVDTGTILGRQCDSFQKAYIVELLLLLERLGACVDMLRQGRPEVIPLPEIQLDSAGRDQTMLVAGLLRLQSHLLYDTF